MGNRLPGRRRERREARGDEIKIALLRTRKTSRMAGASAVRQGGGPRR